MLRFVRLAPLSILLSSPLLAAGLPPTGATTLPISTTYATIVQAPGCGNATFNADASPTPAVAAGEAIDVTIDGKTCSGTIDHVAHGFTITHYSTVEVRHYVTTIVLR